MDIPRNELVVLTGLSGSGKSSLAFDTIYAEGQRRYMESLSSYARQFLGQMEKPDVESIEGLSPAISIDQKSTNRNPRSTVGTVTEIYDYLRLLYATDRHSALPEVRQGDPQADASIRWWTRSWRCRSGRRSSCLAPVVRGRKGTARESAGAAQRRAAMSVCGWTADLYELSEEITLDKNIKHNIEIVVDRLVVKPGIENASDGFD